MSAGECLSEDVVAQLIEGSLDEARLVSAERHLAGCTTCFQLVAAAGSSLEGAGEPGSPSDLPPLAPGAKVGRYVVVAPVGAGGMGRVYAARDPVLDRKVAVKLLHRHATGPELEERLLREAKAMARLAHSEVITVHDVGHHGDQLFIAMEFVDGGTLRQWLAAQPRPFREVLDVLLRAGRGLAAAHANGIVHRDFKPDNVLVGTDRRVRVTDFGLALTGRLTGREESPPPTAEGDAVTPLAPLTRTGAFVGTPAYMAPEQLHGRAADARSDLYGFCVTLWEALYGERPYQGKTLRALQEDKIAGRPRGGGAGRDVPPALRRVLLEGLRPDPSLRPASMEALLAALERAARKKRWPALVTIGVVVTAAGVALARVGTHKPSTTIAAAHLECTTHSACMASHPGTAPWVCRASDHTCQPVASPDCVPMFDPQDEGRSDDTVWLGTMFPATGPNAQELGKMSKDGADLARSEIATVTRALSGESASVRVPRIALVACDDSVDPMRAARHLVEDVGVPAILGFTSGKEVVDVAGSYLIQKRVLTMATLTASTAITRLPQPADLPRMVWRTTDNFEAAAVAAAHLVNDVLEPRAAPNAKATATRVVLARDDNMTSLLPFAEAFYRELTIRGRPAVESGKDYVEIALPEQDPGHASAARVLAVRPTIVVLLAAPERATALVAEVEARWPAGAPRPTYLVAEDSTSILADFIGASAERRARVLSISPVAVPTTTSRFLMRFDAVHPGEASRTINPSSTYDGVYALAYATFAVGTGPVSGPSLARGLSRLASPQGHRIECGPTDLFAGITALTRGDGIDLEGASGHLDFDPATGNLTSDFALLCPALDQSGRASDDVESGVAFLGRERRTAGTLHCP